MPLHRILYISQVKQTDVHGGAERLPEPVGDVMSDDLVPPVLD
jgi:hypothetical protein